MIRLVAQPTDDAHVALDAVAELEAAIARDPRVRVVTTGRLLRRIALAAARLAQPLPVRPAVRAGQDDALAILMRLDEAKLVPHFVVAHRRSVYLFDAWPARHAEILALVRAWRIDHAFVSSRTAAERLAARASRCTFTWVPEGVDATVYREAARDIDVLQLGRKYDALHERIVGPLAAAGRRYVYQPTPQALVFPTRESFIDGLARSRVSICVPSSITHPERSGDIETMTTRYLQSIASGCLVVGRAPREMIDLFGYNPIVELDMADPGRHLLAILGDFERFRPLIERNRAEVHARHQWRDRWDQVARLLGV